MLENYIRTIGQIILPVFLVLSFAGCSSGGNSSTESEPALIVSSKEAVPGSFITIEDDSIKQGAALNVTFDDGAGYEITLKTILTENGYASVPVPPIVNLSTGDFSSSEVTISIPAGRRTTLNILPLPELINVEPGEIVKMYLSYTRDNFQTALDNMPGFSTVSYDTSELEQQIQIQIDSIEASIDELDTLQQLSMFSYDSGLIILGQDDLKKLDQLIYAILKGTSDEINAISSAKYAYKEITAGNVPSVLNNVRLTIKDSQTVLVGIGGLTVTIAGALIIGPEIAAGTTLLYAVQAAGASLLVVGTASEGLAALEAALDENKVYTFGNAYNAESMEQLMGIGLAAGAEAHWLINLATFLNTGVNVKDAINNLICNADPVPDIFVKYCNEWKASRDMGPFRISSVRFYDPFMLPGDEGELAFWLIKGTSDEVSMKIDWGDGGETYPNFGTGEFTSGINHTYYLNDTDTQGYVIRMHGVDESGNENSAQTIVVVSNGFEPNVSFNSVPQKITTNDKNTWGLTIGGIPPYKYEMSWGDGSPKLFSQHDTLQALTLTHTYSQKGIYTVEIKVEDAKGIVVSAISQAEVRDHVSVTSIIGPTSLDLKQDGIWTVNLHGGWEPYGGWINWGDGNEFVPIDSQSRQFTITHAYAEKDTYNPDLTLSDDKGDMDYGDFTVKVPKEDLSFAYTINGTCVEPNVSYPISVTGTLTLSDDGLLTITSSMGQGGTGVLNGDLINITNIVAVGDSTITEVFEGNINIDETNNIMTGNGSYSIVDSDGSLTCTGTWGSN